MTAEPAIRRRRCNSVRCCAANRPASRRCRRSPDAPASIWRRSTLLTPNATRWLEACVWPEHIKRLSNLRAALAIARRDRPQVVAGNAVEVLPRLAAQADPDALLVVVNTNVMLYFSRDERVRYGAQLAALGATRDLVWIANELPVILESGGFTAPTTVQDGGLPLVLRYCSQRPRRRHRARARRSPRPLVALVLSARCSAS